MNSFIANLPWRVIVIVLFGLTAMIQLFYYGWFFRLLAFHKQETKIKSQQHPVSVIICARDEAGNLAKNLPGSLVQTYPSTHEVIVVNHNSQDDTRYLLDEFKKTFKDLHIVNLEYEAIGIPGKKYPLSMGIKEARHEIVLLTDADCVPASEFWIQKMQDGYDNGIQIVLGYSPYRKKPGFLNKLIRFETFHSALQYLSYALAGSPYMGVGRNLSYKRELFFKNKGFSTINHLPGGDDDLFVNQVATDKNTKIVIDPEAFTYSEPKHSFGEWRKQKVRHYSASKFYKARHKWMLGLYSFSHFIFYPLFISNLFLNWKIAICIFGARFLTQGLIYFKSMRKLGEADLFAWWWLFDIWMFFYYLIFVQTLWKKPGPNWN
ncbi:MAG: glycosyl transferase family 2 [Bacteroidetes bacterium]|nr:MAG: glycosyl transferase family 2 [Bacteroidota bacterium]